MVELAAPMTNQIYEKVLEGISPEVRTIVEDGLRAYAKDSSQNQAFTDKVKCERLRKGFDSLTRALIERMGTHNDHQALFFCTGALADEVRLEGKTGDGEITVKLLPREFYDQMLAAFQKVVNLPEEMDYILTTTDRARLIAMGELYALDPQASGKRRPQMTAKKDGNTKAQKEMALSKRNQMAAELETALPTLEKLFSKYLTGNKLLAKDAVDTMRKNYNQATGKEALLDANARAALDKKLFSAGTQLAAFAEENAQVLLQMKDLGAELGNKSLELRKAIQDLEALNAVVSEALRKKYVSYDAEKIGLVKRDIEYTGAFVGKAAESSPVRVATSGSRILLESHLDFDADPLASQICTPENVYSSFQKILKVNPNLFPMSAAGNPVIPRVVIEPVRNVVEWLDDRFLISLVSGEPNKKGAQFSLNPVDMQVMRACGMYLSKDSMFNYRGEQNTGTFMGDYSGKVEKQAKVVFAGADKKMTMIASTAVADAAGRDSAVADYIEFTFNVMNGLTPNAKMSKRRIAILLRYVFMDNLQNTVNLLLRYAGLAELGECRETILKHTQNRYDDAKKLVENAWTVDPQIPKVLGEKPQHYMAKMFG